MRNASGATAITTHEVAEAAAFYDCERASSVDLIKENGVETAKEPGCREFNVMVSAKEPHHVFLFEVYDNAAASEAHRATDHFKKYQAATANMVVKREVRVMSPIVMHSKTR